MTSLVAAALLGLTAGSDPWLAAYKAADDDDWDRKERVWLAYRRAVTRSLDELLPPHAAYWPDCDNTLWPREGEEYDTKWVAPIELRRLPRSRFGECDPPDAVNTWPVYLAHRLRTKAAVQRYLTNNGNTHEARDACKQMMAFAWARETRYLGVNQLTWWTLWAHAPELLNFARTRRTP